MNYYEKDEFFNGATGQRGNGATGQRHFKGFALASNLGVRRSMLRLLSHSI